MKYLNFICLELVTPEIHRIYSLLLFFSVLLCFDLPPPTCLDPCPSPVYEATTHCLCGWWLLSLPITQHLFLEFCFLKEEELRM